MTAEAMAEFFAPLRTPANRSAPREPRYELRLTTVTSYLVVTQRRVATVQGTVAQLEHACARAQAHTASRGWWGIPLGLLWTPLSLWQNARALRTVRARAAAGVAGDPTGTD